MDYTIRKLSEDCARCEHPFRAGDRLFSLILLEEERPSREDLCLACFEARDADPEQEFAFWKTRKSGDGPVRRMVDFNTLRELFFRMAERDSAEYRKICYLLGLVLIRKRVIKLKEFTSEGGVDFLVVTAKQREEPIRLEAPELRSEEFEELRDRLRTLLDMDLGPEDGLSGVGEPEAEAEAGEPEGA